MNHSMILPILIPAVAAAVTVVAARKDIVLARIFSLGTLAALILLATLLLGQASDGQIRSYTLGNWPAPFGILLVLDRLSALMILLTSILSLCVMLYAISDCDRKGANFHPLFLFQITGLNGAFLTGDIFNLFVFFEVLLISSYGLMIHGGGALRTRAGIQYVVINIVGSSLFLISLGMIYGSTGTLNMADIATKAALIPVDQRALF